MEYYRKDASPVYVYQSEPIRKTLITHAPDTLDDIRQLGIMIDHNTIKRVKQALTEAVSGHKLYVLRGDKLKCKKERRQLRRFLYEAGVLSQTGSSEDRKYHAAFDYLPNTTFENPDIVVSRADGHKLSPSMVDIIQNRLLDKMVMVRDSGEASKGRFAFSRSSHSEEGTFTITAKTAEARDWLLGTYLGEISGVELVVSKKQFAGVKVNASIFLHEHTNRSPRELLDFIMHQNKHRNNINFHQWTMVDSSVGPEGTYLKLSIDAESAHNLLTNTLDYKNRTVKLSFP